VAELAGEVATLWTQVRGEVEQFEGVVGVSGWCETSFAERVKLDLQYIDRWSLALDFKILALTIPAVLSGRGAY